MSNFPLGAGRGSVSIYSGSRWVGNVIRVRAGAGLQNKTRVLILSQGVEGIGEETLALTL